MPCRGRRDIPGRPNNKTKAGGGRQVGERGGKGGAWTRGYEGTNKRRNDRNLCIRLFVIFVPSLNRCCNPLLLEHLDFFQWKLKLFFLFENICLSIYENVYEN